MKDKIVDLLYKYYGSDSGYLFGLTPEKRVVVEAIVKSTLAIEKELLKDKGGDLR